MSYFNQLYLLLFAFVLLLVLIGIFRKWVPRKIVISEYEVGLVYRNGVFNKRLTGGSHYILPVWTQVEKVDLRQTIATINSQEILSLDNVALKVSVVCFYKIEDALLARQHTTSYQDTLYAQVQLVIRELIGSRQVDKILEEKQKLNEELVERIRPLVKEYGVFVHEIGIKDITFPGELKKIFAEVVRAQKEGLASLERARGESAALRNLAGTAKLLENNPTLMNLRLLQAFSGNTTGNNTLVLGLNEQFNQVIKADVQGNA